MKELNNMEEMKEITKNLSDIEKMMDMKEKTPEQKKEIKRAVTMLSNETKADDKEAVMLLLRIFMPGFFAFMGDMLLIVSGGKKGKDLWKKTTFTILVTVGSFLITIAMQVLGKLLWG